MRKCKTDLGNPPARHVHSFIENFCPEKNVIPSTFSRRARHSSGAYLFSAILDVLSMLRTNTVFPTILPPVAVSPQPSRPDARPHGSWTAHVEAEEQAPEAPALCAATIFKPLSLPIALFAVCAFDGAPPPLAASGQTCDRFSFSR